MGKRDDLVCSRSRRSVLANEPRQDPEDPPEYLHHNISRAAGGGGSQKILQQGAQKGLHRRISARQQGQVMFGGGLATLACNYVRYQDLSPCLLAAVAPSASPNLDDQSDSG